MEMYLIGGWVRDHILGIDSKDVDFTCVADSFESMQEELIKMGFEIFLSTPEYYTIRARGPKNFEFAGHKFGSMTFDFVWSREDGPSTDGRRPDWVKPGTLLTDMQRRDFTMNAMAMDKDGRVLDPYLGKNDLRDGILRTVGDPRKRFEEDGLRILRALRFSVTKDMVIITDVLHAMDPALLRGVSTERMREELHKMFAFDQAKAWVTLNNHRGILFAVMDAGVNFIPTLKKV